MALPMFLGMMLVGLFALFDKKVVRVEWQAVAGFLAFMSLVTFLRLSLYDYLHLMDPSFIPGIHRDLLMMPKFLFGLVWWEDGFYVLPIYLAFKYLPKKYAITIAILFSVQFGLGHIYQGLPAVFITGLYPYFVSYRYGIKYGFGTVMIGHVLYDFITYYTVILAPYLL